MQETITKYDVGIKSEFGVDQLKFKQSDIVKIWFRWILWTFLRKNRQLLYSEKIMSLSWIGKTMTPWFFASKNFQNNLVYGSMVLSRLFQSLFFRNQLL